MASVISHRSTWVSRWGACGALSASLVLIAVPASAGAGTQRALPGGFAAYRSVSAVRLGMNEKTVRARLGTPSSINLGSSGQRGPSQLIYSRTHPKQSLIITFDQHRRGDPVAHIQASGRAFRNQRGIGTSSSRAAVRHAFPHLKAEHGSLVGQRGPAFMEIDFFDRRGVLIGLADTRLRTDSTSAVSLRR